MQLKVHPDDFIVREHWIPTFSAGAHKIFLLRKTQWNTEDVLQDLSHMLKIPRKDIGYCGNKDKQAVTEQFISMKNAPSEIRTPPTYSLAFLGTRKESLHIGEHERNFFTITIRDIQEKPVLKPIKNYYGEQRFGENNVDVGFALLHKDYKKAATLLNIPFTNDPIAALRTVPKKILLLYVHAVQSMLWNEMAAQLPEVQDSVPIPGFAPAGNPQHKQLMLDTMKKYELTRESFINRSIQELTSEGGARDVLQDVRDFSASDVHAGVCVVSFSLGKSSYATETLKQVC